MRYRVAYAALAAAMVAVLAIDAFRLGYFDLNALVFAVAGIALALMGLIRGAGLRSLQAPRRAWRTGAGGSVMVLSMKVRGAASGNLSARKEIARILASAYLAKSTMGADPTYDAVREAGVRLAERSRATPGLAEVFFPREETDGPGSNPASPKGQDYIASLRAAMDMVGGSP